MFYGEHALNIDAKGRLALPSKFRDSFSDGVVITRGLDNCLFIYTQDTWQGIASQIAALPTTNPKARAYSRLMLAGAWEVTPDKQGRVILPEYLRKHAGLIKHTILAGLHDRLEIWDEDAWHDYSSQNASQDLDLSEFDV